MMESVRISKEDVKRRLDAGEQIVFLDTRSDDAWRKADAQIPGSTRLPPDAVELHFDDIPREGLIVTYCTCTQEKSSARAAQTLLSHGWKHVRPLSGGFEAWQATGYPVEPKTREPHTPSEIAENLRQAEGEQDLPE